jgi:dTDP-4-dehydrorhamnose reductase
MLGRDLATRLEREGEDSVGCPRGELDITDAAAVRETVGRFKPTVLVNCAAWTAVDDAEAHEDVALQVNGHAVAGLAAACADHGVTLVQVSTDYVFDGASRQPYGEGDLPSPRTAYGRSKLAGERAVLDLLASGCSGYVVRTAWLYGAHGRNFVRTMVDLERRLPAIEVVDDQHGQPSWTVDVAGQIIALVRSRAASGVYHATSSGETTWFGLAREVFTLLGADPARVRTTTSEAYPRPAARPSYSVLGHDAWMKAGLDPIGDWKDALRSAFPELLAAFATEQPTRLADAILSIRRARRVCRWTTVAQMSGVGETIGVPGQEPAVPGFSEWGRGSVIRGQNRP